MKYFLPSLLLLLFLVGGQLGTKAFAKTNTVSFGLAYYDINDNERAADFRVEYRWAKPLLWIIKPWAGIEITSDLAFFGAAGFLLDIKISDHIYLTPSTGAGAYRNGNGKDLGHTLEFRNQLEIGYEFDSGNRISIVGGHISNGRLKDRNPGTEFLGIYYHIPFDKLKGGLNNGG